MDFRYLHRSEFQVKSTVMMLANMLLTILNDVREPTLSVISYNMDHLVELVGLCVVNDYLHRTPCIQRISNSLLMMSTNGVDD